MAKSKKKKIITPSKKQDIKENNSPVEVIVNKVQPDALVDFINSDNSLKTVVNKLEYQNQFLMVSANMLMAIAGYLLGESGLNYKSDYSNLKSKIKNTAPILGENPINSFINENSNSNDNNNNQSLLELKMHFENLNDESVSKLHDLVNVISTNFDPEDRQSLKRLSNSILILNEIIKNVTAINFNAIDDNLATKIVSFNTSIASLLLTTKLLNKNLMQIMLLNLFAEQIKNVPKILGEIISGANGNGGLVMLMNRINKAESKGLFIKQITSFLSDFIELFIVLKQLGKHATISSRVLKNIPKSIDVLNEIVDIINKTDINNITNANTNISNLAQFFTDIRKIFIASSIIGVLALPAFIGAILMKKTIKTILEAITDTLDVIKEYKINSDTTEIFKELGKTIAIMSILMLGTALVGAFVTKNFFNIVGFAFTFMAFNIIVLGSIGILSELITEENVDNLNRLTVFIVTCSFVMMIGALFMLSNLWVESLKFAGTLAAFIFAVIAPFYLLNKLFNGGKKDGLLGTAHNMAMLIVVCAGVMMIGALFMLTGLFWQSLGFGLALGVFILLVISPFLLFSKFSGDLDKSVKAIMYLVITCTLILMVGALFMLTGFAEEAIKFGLMVSGFIWLVSLPFLLFGRRIEDSASAILAVLALVVVSTLILTLGAMFMTTKYGEQVLPFAAILVGFVGAMGLIAFLLGKFQKDIWIGVATMAGVALITYITCEAFTVLGEAFTKFGDWENALAMVAIMSGTILALAGIALGLGALLSGPQALVFAVGVAAIGSVTLVALGISKAMKNIGEALLMMKEVSNAKIDTKKLETIIQSFVTVGKAMSDISDKINFTDIFKISLSMKAMARGISEIGNSVALISNLTVGTKWDKDGNPIEFRQLNESDFNNAAINTEKIITALGNALINVYNKKPDMFNKPLKQTSIGFGLFSFKSISEDYSAMTPIEKVITAATKMGGAISSIALGVKDMADLKVIDKWDSNGNPVSYRHLTNTDFTLAADNTSLIINALGDALIAIYNNPKNKGMFDKPLMYNYKDGMQYEGLSPLERVLVTANSMGSAISSIALGIKEMANLSVVKSYDKNGNPAEVIKLDAKELENAKQQTSDVVTALFEAINKVYNDNPDLFKKPINVWTGNEDYSKLTPVEKVISSSKSLGNAIAEAATGIQDIASLHYTAYDANGKTKTISLQNNMLTTNGVLYNRIKMMFSVLGNSISAAYILGKDTYFNPEWEAFANITTSMESITKIVNTGSSTITSLYSALNDKDFSKNGETWQKAINDLLDPFTNTKIVNTNTLDKLNKFSTTDFSKLEQFTKSINSLDDKKTDKFIELTKTLVELQNSMKDMNQFINLLNSKLSNTLSDLSNKLEFASKTIKESDKAQDKRNEFIKENTRKLKEVMETPMKIELTKSDFDLDSLISGSLGSNESGTNNTPDMSGYTNNTSGGMSEENTEALMNISDNTEKILNIIKEYTEN